MPLETPVRVARELATRGYNAEREAVTLIAESDDPALTIELVVESAGEDVLRVTREHVLAAVDSETDDVEGSASARSSSAAESPDAESPDAESPDLLSSTPSDTAEQAAATTAEGTGSNEPMPSGGTVDSTPQTPSAGSNPGKQADSDPPISTGADDSSGELDENPAPVESTDSSFERSTDTSRRSVAIEGDVTGQSTGTGEYSDFVTTFRDRYDRLAKLLRGRVNHRPSTAIAEMPGGSEAAMVGLINDVRSTANGHWLVELEDTKGTFPCLVTKDKDLAGVVDELLMDECIAVEGRLSDDSGILFADSIHFPDVPRTYRPNTADRHVQAALISDVHVGSQEFVADAWHRFADWLHTREAESVEYLLIAGDMVEGVGVYPNQDEELDIVDIYEQYERFAEYLKEVPGDVDVVMIPGNHDAVRLAEPQPGFDEELRNIMSVHDPHITGNPSTVTLEGVSVLMYHGVSLDEVIAELPAEKASYDDPHRAMYQLLKKRHVAPQYGGHMRLAPEEKDYLVVDSIPDVFHTGHVHKLGWGKYHNVLAVNTGCWQAQTAFQKSVNIDPDVGFAPILDLDTLDMTVRKFS